MSRTKEKNFFGTLCKILDKLIAVVILIICIIIVIQRFSNNTQSLLGFRIFRVETGSMVPKYPIGTVIFVRTQDINTIKVGDDLVYSGQKGNVAGMIITHQVIDVKHDAEGNPIFRTKGIANNSPDPDVYPSQVIGTVVSKMYVLTLLTKLFSNMYTLYFVIIMPLTIYIFFTLIRSIDKRNKKMQEIHNRRIKEREEIKNKEVSEKKK